MRWRRKREIFGSGFFDVLLKNLLVLHAISFCFRAYRIVRETYFSPLVGRVSPRRRIPGSTHDNKSINFTSPVRLRLYIKNHLTSVSFTSNEVKFYHTGGLK